MRRAALLLAAPTLLAVAACSAVGLGTGAGPSPSLSIPDPSAACAEAFDTAARTVAPTDEATPDVGEELIEPEAAGGVLAELGPTLGACDSYEDWVAGARSVTGLLGPGFDFETALDLLCQQDPDAAPCAPLPAAELSDEPAPSGTAAP